MYEYRIEKIQGGGMFKAGLIDEKKTQEVLDRMAAEGWRLVTTHVETQSGASMNLTTIWERQKADVPPESGPPSVAFIR